LGGHSDQVQGQLHVVARRIGGGEGLGEATCEPGYHRQSQQGEIENEPWCCIQRFEEEARRFGQVEAAIGKIGVWISEVGGVSHVWALL